MKRQVNSGKDTPTSYLVALGGSLSRTFATAFEGLPSFFLQTFKIGKKSPPSLGNRG